MVPGTFGSEGQTGCVTNPLAQEGSSTGAFPRLDMGKLRQRANGSARAGLARGQMPGVTLGEEGPTPCPLSLSHCCPSHLDGAEDFNCGRSQVGRTQP